MFKVVGETTEYEVTGTTTDPLVKSTESIDEAAKLVPVTTTLFPPVMAPDSGANEVMVIPVGAVAAE